MGLLSDVTDEATLSLGKGQRFIDVWRDELDDKDRELIRSWFEDRKWLAPRIARELAAQGLRLGEDTVRQGLRRLKEAGWDASKT